MQHVLMVCPSLQISPITISQFAYDIWNKGFEKNIQRLSVAHFYHQVLLLTQSLNA